MVDGSDPTWECVSGGNALHFDGVNDLVRVPDDPALDPSGDMTVSQWVKFDVLPSTRGVSAKSVYKQHSVSPWFSYILYVNDSDTPIFTWHNGSTNFVVSSTNETIVTDTWYHLTGVKEGTTLRIYVNGTDTNSTTNIDARVVVFLHPVCQRQ